MCGIAGLIAPEPVRDIDGILANMGAVLHARGPNARGTWVQDERRLGFSHNRLAVVDLSAAGQQPMCSASGRYVITFNGEIYNHADIRRSLEQSAAAPAWRGHSDTEVLLAAIECWGVKKALELSVGMFAFGLWDKERDELHLARDRFGEKPLYYGWAGTTFVFGSELKALCAAPGFERTVDRDALALFMRYLVVPAPHSIFERAYKLEPGCVLTIAGSAPKAPPRAPLRPGERHETMSIKRWWSLSEQFETGYRNPFPSEEEALREVETRLVDAVALQSQADVPLGVFLSGGVDSSLIAALMQRQATRRVQSFTIGSEHSSYDESAHARAVAEHLGTDHYEMFVSDADASSLIPQLPMMFDEPFADSSQIPTHMVCRSARTHVTVALSGDAGDELFGGYNRYLWAPGLWRQASRLPYPLRQLAARAAGSVPISAWDRMLSGIDTRHVGYKVQKLASALKQARTPEDLYRNLISEWREPQIVLGAKGVLQAPEGHTATMLRCADMRARMMFADSIFYLPDDILCKVDRAAMAISLETRAPYLDHRVAAAAWRLPMDMRIRGGIGKWALRQILYRHVPRSLIERPKTGFSVPLGQWLRGPLREWAETLLDERRLRSEGYFDPAPIRKAWQAHLSGRRNMMQSLWAVLMFQSWKDVWLGETSLSHERTH
ncbi:asparagine synthase (glutamine-hydrolyzing) [Sphingomonas sp. ST-64]|uniref:asparagine synthase (glutamine-hydrolyzing) n=1 Tax=Sphingomonas plantiphila TaxID=3163295 RepID=A0ABW8YHY7_9SPHN